MRRVHTDTGNVELPVDVNAVSLRNNQGGRNPALMFLDSAARTILRIRS
jgi:hypothetical protein